MNQNLNFKDNIKELIIIHKNKLDNAYEVYLNNVNDFIENLDNVGNLNQAQYMITWLKQMILSTKHLQNYFNNFPNINVIYDDNLSEKMLQIENESISDEMIKTFIPLMVYYQTIQSLKDV